MRPSVADVRLQRMLRNLLRPEFLLVIVGLLGFLSLAVLLHWTAPGTPHEAVPLRGLREEGGERSRLEVETLAATMKAMEQRLAAMDAHLGQLVGREQGAVQQPAVAAPLLVSQAQVEALTRQIGDAFSLALSSQQRMLQVQAPVPPAPPAPPAPPPPPPPPPPPQPYQYSSDSSTAPWKSELAEMHKAVERLAHQTDDRISSLGALVAGSGVGRPSGADGAEVSQADAEPNPGHACRSPPCSRDEESCRFNGNCCKDFMFEMLVDFSEFLSRNNVTHAVVEGTLLGAIRDKDIIPYTADLDVLVPQAGWKKAMEINADRNRSRSYYLMQDPQEPHCARLCAVWRGMPVNRAPFNKAFPWDTEQVGADLSYYMDIYDEDMDFAKSMEHLIWPLSNVSIRNKSFPAPRGKELYIEARYGPGWKTPDHQSRELEKMYPSLAEGKTWSENTLLLQSARADAMTGLRMLERATVDYKTGNLMLRSSRSQDVPPEPAKRLSVQGLTSDESGRVLGGTAVISPPDEHESDISLYSLYWAMEQMQYSDLSMKRLDAAPVTEQIATTTAPNRDTELVEGNQAHYNVGLSSPPEAASKEKGGEPRPVAKVKRCGAGTGDPFRVCAKRGQPLQVPLPLDLQVPSDATHLIVVTSNEAGEGRDVTTAELSEGSSEARTFSRRVQLGLMAGLLGSSGPNLAGCISQLFAKGGKPAMLLRSGIDDVVKLMIQKKESGMKAALKSLADWLQPIATSLEACKLVGADQAKEKLERALPHLRTGVLAYEPGKVLSVDGETIFRPINYAIGHLRKDKPASFGFDLGAFLKLLAEIAAPKPANATADATGVAPAAASVAASEGMTLPPSSSSKPARNLLKASSR